MPLGVKIIAALGCLALLLYTELTLFGPAPAGPHGGTMSPEFAGRAHVWIVVAGYAGIIVLMIDSFMRKYDTPVGWPLAWAIIGLGSFGLGSLIYFLGWGWPPARPGAPAAEAFCQRCVEESQPVSAGEIFSNNGVGPGFFGASHLCSECGSTIKTYWVFAFLPVFPMAAYRVLSAGHSGLTEVYFISRLTRFQWPHVLPWFGLVTIVVLVPVIRVLVG